MTDHDFVDGFTLEVVEDDGWVLRSGSQFIEADFSTWQDELLPALQERAAMYERYLGLRDSYAAAHNDLEFSWDKPYLLIEGGSHDSYITLFESLEAAGEYCYSGEGDWHPERVIDLRDGKEYFPSTSTVFRPMPTTAEQSS